MKKFLSALICLLMVLQLCVGLMILPASASEENKLYDGSDIWVTEYKIDANGDYGYRNTQPASTEDGVLKFAKDNGIRLNWQNISGFEAFDANNVYTFRFDVKVTDFGDDTTLPGSAAWNREVYFAPGGYYNQIEFRSGNYTNQLGVRAGDNSSEYPKGGWTNDLAAYKLDTVYSCTVEWKPSEGKMISTVKDGDTIIAQGARTNDNYKTLNKYTKSFVWRCEDGAMELDNFVFSDGVHVYEQDFEFGAGSACEYDAAYTFGFDSDVYALPSAVFSTEIPFPGNGSNQGNNCWDKATSPALLDDGSMLFEQYDGLNIYPENIDGISLDADKTYTIKFDAEILAKGDGTDVRPAAGWSREFYFGFGGYYNQVEFKSSGNGIRAGDKVAGVYDNGGWNGDKEYALGKYSIEVVWSPSDKTVTSTVKLGDEIIAQGRRSGAQYVTTDAHATLWTWRCEGGSFKLSDVSVSDGDNTYEVDFADNFVDLEDENKDRLWYSEGGSYGTRGTKVPSVEDGVLKLETNESAGFVWKKYIGEANYSANASYTFEFDVKVTNEGNGSNLSGNANHTGILYVAFGGYYDQVRINNAGGKVYAGEKEVAYESAKYLNKTVHVTLTLCGKNATSIITDEDGNVLNFGTRRNKADYASTTSNYMKSIFLRCEDGAVEIDNFKFVAQDLAIDTVHDPEHSVLVNVAEVNCKDNGYTGDKLCPLCGEIVEAGEVIEASGEHNYGEWTEGYGATCTTEGLRGHYFCVGCEKYFNAK
ncbi:MAG: hypothetical protein E7642_07220, partial [Ruminococcaceae bacterium]|nr:hypothetical protein [Oscillospiraceae bacterium]